MDFEAAFSEISSTFDENLPKKRRLSYLQAFEFGYTLGDLIFKTFGQLEQSDQRALYLRLEEWIERRCSPIKWRNAHSVPRGEASSWLQSHFSIVLRECRIEYKITLEEA